jgi:ABC-type Zn uptake system ZnuABC Zn-binding protein ZnuA
LEEFLERLIASAQAEDRVVALSEDVLLLESEDPHKEPEDENESEEHHGGDPHTWTDPNNVLLWVDAVELALVKVDPTNANLFRENANTYREELRQLDSWVREQVAHIPPEDRLLVTDHTLFTYFAHTYGFTQVGAVVESYSTLAEPSAQELAVLEDSIRALGVKAVFVGSTVNPGLASRVSRDTGVRLVPIYTGSLSESDGEAATYLDYIRYNTLAIVEALK